MTVNPEEAAQQGFLFHLSWLIRPSHSQSDRQWFPYLETRQKHHSLLELGVWGLCLAPMSIWYTQSDGHSMALQCWMIFWKWPELCGFILIQRLVLECQPLLLSPLRSVKACFVAVALPWPCLVAWRPAAQALGAAVWGLKCLLVACSTSDAAAQRITRITSACISEPQADGEMGESLSHSALESQLPETDFTWRSSRQGMGWRKEGWGLLWLWGYFVVFDTEKMTAASQWSFLAAKHTFLRAFFLFFLSSRLLSLTCLLSSGKESQEMTGRNFSFVNVLCSVLLLSPSRGSVMRRWSILTFKPCVKHVLTEQTSK